MWTLLLLSLATQQIQNLYKRTEDVCVQYLPTLNFQHIIYSIDI